MTRSWRATLSTLAASAVVVSCDLVLGIHPPPAQDGSIADGQTSDVDAGPSCGTFGQPCCAASSCNDGTQCLSREAGAQCVAFAGTYETAFQPTPCGVSKCVNPNPYLPGTCACPNGPLAEQTGDIDVTCADDASSPSHLAGSMGLCGIDKLPSGSDWGGAYVQADIASCEPTTDAGCTMPNAITGSCSCPDAGMEALALRIYVTGTTSPGDGGCNNPYLGGELTVCLPTGVTPTTIFGVYELDAFNVCKHSQALNGCACPPNTVPSQLRSLEEYPSNCGSTCTQFPQSTITFCVAP